MSESCLTCGLEVPDGLDLCPRDGTPVLAGQSAADPLIGTKLGDYVITSRIGGGGMGIVYEALQPVINKRVAVKVIRPDVGRDEKSIQRFLEEARTSTSIRHRGIVDVFNFGQLPDGRPYMVMEYLNGASLDELIAERGSMNVSECLWILDEVLSALIAAHRAGVIHRDLKPSNIFVVTEPSSGSRYTKLLDFGIAKLSKRATEDTWHTEAAAEGVVGTVHYMAPEQLRVEAISPRTDLYALGCVAYELLTGHPPFKFGSAAQVAAAHLEKAPARLTVVLPDTPPAVDGFVFSLLAKRPDERPRSARAARETLKSLRTALGLVRFGDLSHDTTNPKLEVFDSSTYVRDRSPTERLLSSRSRWIAALGACAILATAAVPAFRLLAFQPSTRLPAAQESTNREKLEPALPHADPTIAGTAADEPGAPLPADQSVEALPPTADATKPSNRLPEEQRLPDVPQVAPSPPPLRIKSVAQRRKRRNSVASRQPEPKMSAEPRAEQPRVGYLTIDAAPWAHVKINGRYIRDTPIADYAVQEGPVTIEFEHPELGRRVVKRVVKAGTRELVSERFE